MRTRVKPAVLAMGAIALVVLSACSKPKGEDRPNVEVIGGEGTVSISASAAGPSPGVITPSQAGGGYTPVSNVDTYVAIGADIRDMRALMSQPIVAWPSVTAIYEQGRNQINASTGAVRSMAALPDNSRQAMFPNGATVYGRSNFIDATVRDGIAGTGRAAGLPDAARRQIVEKGLLMIAYSVALQELDATRQRVAANNLDPATGAPHTVDESWGTAAGPAEGTAQPYSIFGAADALEEEFSLEGKLREPLESAYVSALAAATAGNAAAVDKAISDIRGYLNATFYLGTISGARKAQAATDETSRAVALAEGWGYFQSIRAFAAQGSTSQARAIEESLSRPATSAFGGADTSAIYNALNEPAVLAALGVPASLVVKQ